MNIFFSVVEKLSSSCLIEISQKSKFCLKTIFATSDIFCWNLCERMPLMVTIPRKLSTNMQNLALSEVSGCPYCISKLYVNYNSVTVELKLMHPR